LTAIRVSSNSREHAPDTRSDWSRQRILDLFALSFIDLLYRAHETHRYGIDTLSK